MDTKRQALVVNLFAGPGAGKSTLAASIFSELKWENINSELVTEYAKDKVWEDASAVLRDQLYVFGKQLHRLEILRDKVDVIVTDSPILFSLIYKSDKYDKYFDKLVLERFNSFDNLNLFVNRLKPYNPSGRLQTEDEAHEKNEEVYQLLVSNDISFYVVNGERDAVPDILHYIHRRLI